jgi:hypothetical protein
MNVKSILSQIALTLLTLSAMTDILGAALTIPHQAQLSARASSFCDALLKGDTKQSFRLTIYYAKRLATFERWQQAFGSSSNDVQSCRSVPPIEIIGDEFAKLSAYFRERSISIDSAVYQRWQVHLRGEDDDDTEEMVGLWVHNDGAWYFVDTSLCDPIELKTKPER